jgi:hypothetical protein
MSRARRATAVLAVLVVTGATACAGTRDTGEAPAAAAGTTTGAATPSPSPSATQATPSPGPTLALTAEEAVAAFVGAATAADAALRLAATHIDGAVSTGAVTLDEETVAAVRAIDLAAVRASIPAGLPAAVLEPVLVVYGDLASRHAAMADAGVAARTHPRPGTEADELLACLPHGSVAAARFAADLDAVHAAARSTPAPAAVAPDARAGAELAARLAEITLRNTGCGTCGGFVPTDLSDVVWEDAAPDATMLSGTVAGTRVDATYTAAGGWVVELHAC